MMILSHPFRFARGGAVATVEDDTDAAYAEAIAVTTLTRKGERPLVPWFGVTDPTFTDAVDVAELNVALEDFGPGVQVTGAETTWTTDTAARVVLTYEETT